MNKRTSALTPRIPLVPVTSTDSPRSALPPDLDGVPWPYQSFTC